MAVISINRSDSRCLNCPRGKDGANPNEEGHYTILGYGSPHKGEPGCGEPWTGVTSDYAGGSFDNIEEHYFGFEHLRGLPVHKFRWGQ